MAPSNLAARLANMLPEKRQYTLQALPSHLIAGGMWKQLELMLCDLEFIEAKCAAGMAYDLPDDYSDALNAWPGAHTADALEVVPKAPPPPWLRGLSIIGTENWDRS